MHDYDKDSHTVKFRVCTEAIRSCSLQQINSYLVQCTFRSWRRQDNKKSSDHHDAVPAKERRADVQTAFYSQLGSTSVFNFACDDLSDSKFDVLIHVKVSGHRKMGSPSTQTSTTNKKRYPLELVQGDENTLLIARQG